MKRAEWGSVGSNRRQEANRHLTRLRPQWFAKRKSVGAILREVMFNRDTALVDPDALPLGSAMAWPFAAASSELLCLSLAASVCKAVSATLHVLQTDGQGPVPVFVETQVPPRQSAAISAWQRTRMFNPIGRNDKMTRSRSAHIDRAPVSRSCYEADQPSDGATETQASASHGMTSEGAMRALVERPEDEMWNLKAVVARTGLSRSSIYSYIAQGLFPRQRRLGLRRVGWLASEVRALIRSRPI